MCSRGSRSLLALAGLLLRLVSTFQVSLDALISEAQHVVLYTADVLRTFVSGSIMCRKHGPDGCHALVENRLGNVPRLLTAAKVL